MKKQTTIDFLVKHLEQWPTRLGGAPAVSGWRWCKPTRKDENDLFLFDEFGVDCESIEQLKISRKDWLAAQLDSATPQTNDTAKVAVKNDKPKIYIAGPMAGHPDFNRKAFNNAMNSFLTAGYIVLNPAILPDGLSQKEYMQIDIAMIQCCDAIFLLKGWQDSLGANAECSLAEKLGLKIIEEE